MTTVTRILPLAGLLGPAFAGLTPLGEHLNVSSRFENGEWANVLQVFDTLDPYDPSEAFLPLSDKPWVEGSPGISGARFTQPSSAAFTFTGAAPGDPIWRAVQGTPGIGEAWPGFDNDQNIGTFGEYIPSDPRVSQATQRPWIKITLVSYQPPAGKASHFSMWQISQGQPIVWMSTADSSVEDAYYLGAGSHIHADWGFTALGIHKVTLQSSAFLGPGETNPTGPGDPFTLTFAVGTVGRWQATWFDADELDDPAISGMDADPDLDGLVNLLEYAFGTNPRVAGPVPVEPGLGFPVFSLVEDEGTLYETLTYPRRRAGDRLMPEIYQPEFSSDLSSPWGDAGVVTTAADFDPPLDGLNAGWELVTSRRPASPGATRGFGRVDVTAGDGF